MKPQIRFTQRDPTLHRRNQRLLGFEKCGYPSFFSPIQSFIPFVHFKISFSKTKKGTSFGWAFITNKKRIRSPSPAANGSTRERSQEVLEESGALFGSIEPQPEDGLDHPLPVPKICDSKLVV
ncbi:hypothetical protein CEXT_562401 [Caerostris extrusa]|uniref:Uncharacterized protein n=1 Tax=Caerostris extrusa TaxID=172846 RepID=A0AAV4NYF7_CAEEX|nr:hypothetical protein CEXT_562401 [Caerostris extrusa]